MPETGVVTYDEGDGPAIVLVHAGIADAGMWDPQVPPLRAAGYRVVRVDLPGFGASPPYAGDPADAVLTALDTLDPVAWPAPLVGASFGGYIAQRIAAARPAGVRALLLVCAAFSGDAGDDAALAELDRREAGLLAAGDLDGAAKLNVDAWLGPDAGAEARDRLTAMKRHALDVQRHADAGPRELPDVDPATLPMPALILTGGHDFPSITERGRRAAARMPRARHLHLPGAGHLPNLERPEDFTKLLLDFAAEHA